MYSSNISDCFQGFFTRRITTLEPDMLPSKLSSREKEWICTLHNHQELRNATADKSQQFFLSFIEELRQDYDSDKALPFCRYTFDCIASCAFNLRGKTIAYAKNYPLPNREIPVHKYQRTKPPFK